jgi:thiol-disulfide isomerase/thioredoxin
MKQILTLVLCMAALASCDIIDNPVQTPDGPIDTTSKVKQNVLIEDYTGHTCGNCPAAAEVATQLQETYSDERVIVVAVHAGNFAKPAAGYETDYRCPAGNELDATFRNSAAGNPNGLVNRTTTSGKFILYKEDWAPVTAQELEKKPKLDLGATSTWDSTSKTVDVAVDVNYLEDGTADYYLCAWIIENGMIGDQTDYRAGSDEASHIHDYKFNHVLRTSIGGTWGVQLSTTDVPANTKILKSLSYTFPAGTTWVPDNCEVVVFVHRHQTEKNVVQVIKIPLK